MLLLLLSLLVSAPEAPGVRAAGCALAAAAGADERAAAVREALAPAHTDKAAGRPEAPSALPASRVSLSLRLQPSAAYAAPALTPLGPEATPSSQRDPPASLA